MVLTAYINPLVPGRKSTILEKSSPSRARPFLEERLLWKKAISPNFLEFIGELQILRKRLPKKKAIFPPINSF